MTRLNELNIELDRSAPATLAGSTDTQALINEARSLRAKAVASLAKQGVAAIARAWHRQRTIKHLNSLSDWMLEDIGLSRGQIVAVATQLAARPADATPRAKPRAKPVVRSFLAKSRRARLRRATIRELQQLPDRVLADIGISRANIPAAVDSRLAKQNARPPATQSKSPVHELRARLEGAIRPLRQWHLSRVAAGQIARLGNATLADLGYVKGDIDWVSEDLAKRKIANTSHKPHAGAA